MDSAAAEPSPAGWREHARREALLWLAAAGVSAAAMWLKLAQALTVDWWAHHGARVPGLVFLVLPAGFALILFLRDRVFPGTEGTGIAQTLAALHLPPDGPVRRALLNIYTAAGKVLLTTLSLAVGAAVGRGGPALNIGAALADSAGRVGRWPAAQHREGLLVAGVAAGLAASFNAPLAGLVLAAELLGFAVWRRHLWLAARAVAVACATDWLLAGNFLFYGKVTAAALSWEAWWLVPVVALPVGAAGGLFARALLAAMAVLGQWTKARWWAVALGAGLALAGLAAASGGLSLGGGRAQVAQLLVEAAPVSPAYALWRAASTLVTLAAATPGGLFDPVLSIGAGCGEWYAALWPHLPRPALLLLAMGAFFTGVLRTPLGAAVLLVEMTAAPQFALPLLAATLLAAAAARAVQPARAADVLAQRVLARVAPGDRPADHRR